MGYFDFLSFLIVLGAFLIVFLLLAMVFRSFRMKVTLKKDRNKRSFDINFRDKRSITIIGIFTVEIVVTLIILIFDLPIILFWAILGFLDIFIDRFIKAIGNNKWLIYQQITWTAARIIIFAWQYLLIDWVLVCVIAYFTITLLMHYNLDYIYLKAFVPDVVFILFLYGTPFILIVEVLGFASALYLYVFD